MKIGVFLGTQHPGDADMRRAFQDHLEQTRALRYEGYDAVWVGQHYLTYPEQFFQTTPLLARLAAEAGGMTIGTNRPLMKQGLVSVLLATIGVSFILKELGRRPGRAAVARTRAEKSGPRLFLAIRRLVAYTRGRLARSWAHLRALVLGRPRFPATSASWGVT